jgi:hypothetical protein
MTEKRRKTIIFVIFIAAVIWGISNLPLGNKPDTQANLGDNVAGDSLNISGGDGATQRTDVFAGDEWGRDPFARKVRSVQTRDYTVRKLNLTAISQANDEYLALINGKALAVGEKIDGWTITDISDKSAALSNNRKNISLNIEDAQK